MGFNLEAIPKKKWVASGRPIKQWCYEMLCLHSRTSSKFQWCHCERATSKQSINDA